MRTLNQWLILSAAVTLPVVALGCANRGNSSQARVQTPGISTDSPLPRRGLTDPNAQYAVLAQPKLLTRPAMVPASQAANCASSALSVYEIAAMVNGNLRAVRLAFANRGATACKLGGYPEVALTDTEGNVAGAITLQRVNRAALEARFTPGSALQATAVTSAAPSPEVVLMPESTAAFDIAWHTGPDCTKVAGISVTAPPQKQEYSISRTLRVCSGQIMVTAVAADPSGD
jgi:Protein of unknown function (DUF4232)